MSKTTITHDRKAQKNWFFSASVDLRRTLIINGQRDRSQPIAWKDGQTPNENICLCIIKLKGKYECSICTDI